MLGRTPSLTRIISSYTDCLLFSLSFFFAADHPTSREYPEEFLVGARAVARLAQEHGENISWERVRSLIDRISKSKPILFLVPSWTFTLSLVNESFLSVYPLQGIGIRVTFPRLTRPRDGSRCSPRKSRRRSTQQGG